MKKRCFIAGAGEYTGLVSPLPGDYVIAADGGYAQLVSRGIVPDLVIGDFDSLGEAPDHPNIVRSPAEKDDTDMMLAVREGLSRGLGMFIIDGGLDGRLDHTIANFQILVYLARRGALGVLLGREVCVTAITNGSLKFYSGRENTKAALKRGDIADAADTEMRCGVSADSSNSAMRGGISVFSAGEAAEGVTLAGLKYPLDGATITCDYPIGVSNEFTGTPATVSVRSGALLVTWTSGPELLEGMYEVLEWTS